MGFTATQMSGDELSGFHKMGAYAGGFVNWRFIQNPHWTIQPEINFVMKGSSAFLRADKNGNIGNKHVLTLYYIEVPALAKYRIVKGLEIEFGPTFGVLLPPPRRMPTARCRVACRSAASSCAAWRACRTPSRSITV